MNDDSQAHLLRVHAPLAGWCDTLDDSPDPVFRDRVLGDGVSIDPTAGDVLAPFDGEVTALPETRHAINLRAGNGVEVMIHVGIDTVALKGEGFTAHVRAGDRVSRGQKLLSFEMDDVLRRVPSLRTPVILLDGDSYGIRHAAPRGAVEPGDIVFEVFARSGDEDAAVGEQHAETAPLTRTATVGLAHGIHARPAAAIISALANLDARAEVRTDDGRSADARSATAMMALGVAHGQAVTIAAQGPDAERALALIVPALEPLTLHDGSVTRVEREAVVAPDEPAMPPPEPGTIVRARSVGSGLAVGVAARLDVQPEPPAAADGRNPDRERQRLDDALGVVREFLERLSETRSGPGGEIAAAHLALLGDPQISARAESRIAAGESAASAWDSAVRESAEALRRLDDERMRARVDDLMDIDHRVQRVLAGQPPELAPALPDEAVLIADTLLPSQLLEIDAARVSGICTAAGGTTSHVAILAESMGIPMLVAAGDMMLGIADGTTVCIDADYGELTIQPDDAMLSRFRKRIDADAARRDQELAAASEPCVTADGVAIKVLANLARIEDAGDVVAGGADGCGLLRTEFLFAERSAPPDSDEQLQVYQRISDALGERPLTVRLLDAGGDKPIAYLRRPAEENPALGIRGIRLLLEHPRLLAAQLDALLRVRRKAPLRIMIPMVAALDEIDAVRGVMDGIRPDREAQLGVMIETPAAALLADELARRVDFFSIGTNDLTQYVLAMDRGEPKLAARLDALDPAVLRLVQRTTDAADRHGRPVGVCGAAAGDPLAAPVLLGLGIRELSVAPRSVAGLKARIRGLRAEDCSALAEQALGADSAESARNLVRNFLDR